MRLALTLLCLTVSAAPAAATTLSAKRVAALVEEALRERAAELPGRVVEVSVRGASRLRVAGTAADVEIHFRSGEDFAGSTAVELRVPRRSGKPRRVWLGAKVRRLVPALRAGRKLKVGELVTSGDVEWTEIDAAKRRDNTLTDISDAVGLEVRSAVPKGRTLLASALRAPVVVRRGAQVTLVSAHGALSVTAPGRVNADGARGDLVQVTSLASNRRLLGRVRDGRTVEVVAR